ncbi:hypothetical protein J7J83_03570 [bacterium]|nr:hypothetical protein [bacterium]
MNEPKVLVDKTLITKGVENNVQKMINKPQTDPTGVNATDAQYIQTVISLINEGKIDLHTPSTLMKNEIYHNIDDKAKGLADINAVTLLNDLRQMKKLYDLGNTQSFQIQNLINRIRNTKERIEKTCGDVYII